MTALCRGIAMSTGDYEDWARELNLRVTSEKSRGHRKSFSVGLFRGATRVRVPAKSEAGTREATDEA
jgi:hypothetical protein